MEKAMKGLGQGTIAPPRYDTSSCIAGDLSSTAAPDSHATLTANWVQIVERRVHVATAKQAPVTVRSDEAQTLLRGH